MEITELTQMTAALQQALKTSEQAQADNETHVDKQLQAIDRLTSAVLILAQAIEGKT